MKCCSSIRRTSRCSRRFVTWAQNVKRFSRKFENGFGVVPEEIEAARYSKHALDRID